MRWGCPTIDPHTIAEPSPWVTRFAGLVKAGGTVLDVACGSGRHARWFESRGHRVTAIDRDEAALAQCGATETIACDLEAHEPPAWPVAGQRFAAVVVTNYLHRPLFASLVDALGDDGVLIYETFALGNAAFGKPSNPAFLLRPGELLEVARGLNIVAFEDGLVDSPRPASVQRLCAVRSRSEASRHAL